MKWLAARLREPSTYAGIAAIAIAAGTAFPSLMPVTHSIAAGCGGMAVALKELTNA